VEAVGRIGGAGGAPVRDADGPKVRAVDSGEWIAACVRGADSRNTSVQWSLRNVVWHGHWITGARSASEALSNVEAFAAVDVDDPVPCQNPSHRG